KSPVAAFSICPGVGSFAGSAKCSPFEMDGKHPRTVVVISIDEVYFQCASAVMRAELWNGEHFADQAKLPTPGQMLKAATGDF
ncbi:hypothetical protein ACC733_38285, partial [Rhizobium johnstonii]